MQEIKEIIVKKTSVYHTSLSNMHLLESIYAYLESNRDKFTSRSWDCSVRTSLNITQNILYSEEEFKHLANEIENIVKNLLYKSFARRTPFHIYESWINIYREHGYQESHTHRQGCGVGCLYLTEQNSDIEFIIFSEDIRTRITPKKGDILFSDGGTWHRVLESKNERLSLAFNFVIEPASHVPTDINIERGK